MCKSPEVRESGDLTAKYLNDWSLQEGGGGGGDTGGGRPER